MITLFMQVLQKFIWTSGGTFSHLLQDVDNTERCSSRGQGLGDVGGLGGGKKRKTKCEGNSSDDDDVSDDVLAELVDIDDDNDDIEEFSDVDDDDDDEEDDDDIGTSDSDGELRKSIEESKEKQSKSNESGIVKKTKTSLTAKKRKDSGVKRSHEAKISESEPEIELAVGGVKKQKIEVSC